MKAPNEIKMGLECCAEYGNCSNGCPYNPIKDCGAALYSDALAYIQQLEFGKWELFDLLSSVWYGKCCYFKQENGTVYSRATCKYLTFDQAIDEFASTLTYAQEE